MTIGTQLLAWFSVVDPIRLSWIGVEWLGNPVRVVLPLLVIIGLSWFFRSRRSLRRLRNYAIALLVGYLILISPPFVALATAGIAAPLPPDPGTKVDAIVVLGRGREHSPPRADVAAQLWRNNRAPIVFVSGIVDAPELATMIRAQNVPAPAVSGESCSRTTWENALFTKAILRDRGVKQILLVTDVPHLWRSLLIFEQAGFAVIPHTSPLKASMTTAEHAMLLLREYFFLATYPKSLQQEQHTLQQPLSNVTKEIADRQCRIEG